MRVKPKLGPYLERIAAILDSDRELPRKQRHTAKRIFERLRDEGYSGGYTQVKEAVRELKRSGGEVVVPLVQEPGEAQVNFGYALVKLAGSLSKVAFFALELPYSDAMFIAAYPRECTETFQDGHVRAFGFLQGVPRRIGYDNARTTQEQYQLRPTGGSHGAGLEFYVHASRHLSSLLLSFALVSTVIGIYSRGSML